jgi:hypothetical protein
MGIDFRIRDFAHPFSILKLKRTFDRNQWQSEEALLQYQSERLRQTVRHAYHNVPYYQKFTITKKPYSFKRFWQDSCKPHFIGLYEVLRGKIKERSELKKLLFGAVEIKNSICIFIFSSYFLRHFFTFLPYH